MAKLNKTEVSAIARKILRDINNNVKVKNDEIKNNAYVSWYYNFKQTREFEVISKLCEYSSEANHILEDLSYENRVKEYNIGSIINELFKKYCSNNLNLHEINVKFEDLENEIIINQALNSDISNLIKELTEKYS